jgi:hypothetical protein
MKKFVVCGLLALALAATSMEKASAWTKMNMGIGAALSYQSGGDKSVLWGAWRTWDFPHNESNFNTTLFPGQGYGVSAQSFPPPVVAPDHGPDFDHGPGFDQGFGPSFGDHGPGGPGFSGPGFSGPGADMVPNLTPAPSSPAFQGPAPGLVKPMGLVYPAGGYDSYEAPAFWYGN